MLLVVLYNYVLDNIMFNSTIHVNYNLVNLYKCVLYSIMWVTISSVTCYYLYMNLFYIFVNMFRNIVSCCYMNVFYITIWISSWLYITVFYKSLCIKGQICNMLLWLYKFVLYNDITYVKLFYMIKLNMFVIFVSHMSICLTITCSISFYGNWDD